MSACEDVRMSLAAHMLGGLEPDEAVLVEAHLVTCPECRAEFDELSGVTAMLARVSEQDIEQAASPPQAVLDRLVAASARRRRAHRLLLGLAASLVAVVVGGTAWVVVGRPHEGTVTAASAPSVSRPASDPARRGQQDGAGRMFAATPVPSAAEQPMLKDAPATPAAPNTESARVGVPMEGGTDQVHAKILMIPGSEGTTVEVSITGVPDGTSCRVSALGSDGTVSPAGSWTIGQADYQGGPATFTGHTELTVDRIRGFEIRESSGRRLLSLP
ncbi:anti-sigma factor family protein [Sphaerisporangium rhizosphaerae]|uniref:Anti-sigma factor family protein n=1 Tax=Sphaerisporangium rhizosphaerae TaxID=2269375 RepID=A0ABW2NWS4_9ACTN